MKLYARINTTEDHHAHHKVVDFSSIEDIEEKNMDIATLMVCHQKQYYEVKILEFCDELGKPVKLFAELCLDKFESVDMENNEFHRFVPQRLFSSKSKLSIYCKLSDYTIKVYQQCTSGYLFINIVEFYDGDGLLVSKYEVKSAYKFIFLLRKHVIDFGYKKFLNDSLIKEITI